VNFADIDTHDLVFTLSIGERLENRRDAARRWLRVSGVEEFLRASPAPAPSALSFFVEDRIIREDHAAFGIHPCAAGAPDEVMKIADRDAVLSLINAAMAAGLVVHRMETKDGRVIIVTSGGRSTAPIDELDRELAEFEARHGKG